MNRGDATGVDRQDQLSVQEGFLWWCSHQQSLGDNSCSLRTQVSTSGSLKLSGREISLTFLVVNAVRPRQGFEYDWANGT